MFNLNTQNDNVRYWNCRKLKQADSNLVFHALMKNRGSHLVPLLAEEPIVSH